MELIAIVWIGAGVVALLGRVSRLVAAVAVLAGAVQVVRFADAGAVLVGGALAVGGGWVFVRYARRRRALPSPPEVLPRAHVHGAVADDEDRLWAWLYARLLAPIELLDDPMFAIRDDDDDDD